MKLHFYAIWMVSKCIFIKLNRMVIAQMNQWETTPASKLTLTHLVDKMDGASFPLKLKKYASKTYLFTPYTPSLILQS